MKNKIYKKVVEEKPGEGEELEVVEVDEEDEEEKKHLEEEGEKK